MPDLLTLCCALVLAGPAELPAAAATQTDSVRAHSQARSAVRNYVRSANPRTILELRDELIHRLDELAREIPGDDWIAGHRVGLRIKQGWLTPAVAAAIRCEGSPWWCESLAGFAFHAEGSIEEAEAAFDSAFVVLPREKRCAWGAELLHVLDGELRDRYRSASCDERIAMEAEIWWLADPLHGRPGNDRRTEHYARVVGMELHHQILAITSGAQCAGTHHETVLRSGWPEGWWSAIAPLDERGHGSRFMPDGGIALRPLESEPDHWFREPTTTSEVYDPPYGELAPLEQQTAFFARGDSILALTAGIVGRVESGALVLSRGPEERFVHPFAPGDGPFRFRAVVPRERYLVSVEAQRLPRGALRTRFGHALPERAPSGLALSDLLLFRWDDDVDQDLDAVEPRMLQSPRLEGVGVIGLYWETYGATDPDGLEVSLSAQPVEAGALRRIAESLRLVEPRDAVAVRWSAGGADGEILRTHLRLDLSLLGPGSYLLRLEVREEGGEPAGAERAIEIVAR